jgi:hypothetical protein
MNNRNLTIMAGVLPALILLQSTPSIAQCAPNAAISLNFTKIALEASSLSQAPGSVIAVMIQTLAPA